MIIKEITSKSCLTKSKLTDYVINPYTGCQHGCKYCYATFIKRFQNIKEPWGEFIHIKKNCIELLEKELKKNKPGHIWLSSVTDAYQPIENRTKLTREILKTILPHKNKFTVEILTKSSLVKRDFGIIKKLNSEIGLSINTLDKNVTKIIEPLASKPLERIKTLKQAEKENIKVYGFISPLLPGITNLEELFKELNFCNHVYIELLNTRKPILNRLMPVIKKHFPEKIKDFEFAINNPEQHFKEIEKQAKVLSKKYNLKIKLIIKH